MTSEKTIYQIAIEKVSEFKGEKLTVWSSGTKEVYLQANENGDAMVFATGVSGYWKVGYLSYNIQDDVMSYKPLRCEYTLKRTYRDWCGKVA